MFWMLAFYGTQKFKVYFDLIGSLLVVILAFDVYTDSRKLGHLYMDRALPGISGVSSTHWNERNVSPSMRKEVWPSSFENSSVSTGTERPYGRVPNIWMPATLVSYDMSSYAFLCELVLR